MSDYQNEVSNDYSLKFSILSLIVLINCSIGILSCFCVSRCLRVTELSSDVWEHKYSRQEAAYPASFLKQNKFWPPVARVDNVYGDKNIFCTCPSMDEFKEDAA